MFTVTVPGQHDPVAVAEFHERLTRADLGLYLTVRQTDVGVVCTFKAGWFGPPVTPELQAKCEAAVEAAASLTMRDARPYPRFPCLPPLPDSAPPPTPVQKAKVTRRAKRLRTKVRPLDAAAFRECFYDVLDRDEFIFSIYRKILKSIDTGMQAPCHALLVGDPAGGKTRILHGFRRLLGDDLCLYAAMTSTRKAGVEDKIIRLAHDGTLPPFLLFEEIEKGAKDLLEGLLPVMDENGRLVKLNSRVDEDVATPCMVIASCNDEAKLRKKCDALVSRFGLPYTVGRPTRDVLREILLQHIARFGGDPRWVPRVLSIMYDDLGTNDARVGKDILAEGEELMQPGFADKFRRLHNYV